MHRCMVRWLAMIWQDAALSLAGAIGAAVAIVHGRLVQRLLVTPLVSMAGVDRRFSGATRRLVPPLIHFSTVVWFLGGLALMVAGTLAADARLAISGLVGATYLFGAIANLWATRGRHPGWMLMAVAVALIAAGAAKPGV